MSGCSCGGNDSIGHLNWCLASSERQDLKAETAIKSSLPVHSGDGYGYGGGAVVTIGSFSILFGEGEPAHWLAQEVANRWNGERNGDRDNV
jgi:hypothetical protein